MTSDPLEDLLCPPPEANGSRNDLRDALRRQTTGAIRRRRWRRHLVRAAAAALLFGAGMGVMAWLRPSSGVPSLSNSILTEIDPLPTAVPSPPLPSLSPLDLEDKAFDLPQPKKAEAQLAAGRKYFAENQDYDAALRCYRQALDSGPASLRQIEPEDDWLVLALKLDHQKED